MEDLCRRLDRLARSLHTRASAHRRIVQISRPTRKGLTSYATAWDGLPCDSRGRRLHLSSHRSRRRAAGHRRRGSGQNRSALRRGLRFAGQRAALRSRRDRPARRLARDSRGGAEHGQRRRAAIAVGRPRDAARRRARSGLFPQHAIGINAGGGERLLATPYSLPLLQLRSIPAAAQGAHQADAGGELAALDVDRRHPVLQQRLFGGQDLEIAGDAAFVAGIG